jgi:TrmH family RNA methyltransferase
MGSERQGLPKPMVDICQKIVSIPMKGSADSLNLAVATGILLYEIRDQLDKVE